MHPSQFFLALGAALLALVIGGAALLDYVDRATGPQEQTPWTQR